MSNNKKLKLNLLSSPVNAKLARLLQVGVYKCTIGFEWKLVSSSESLLLLSFKLKCVVVVIYWQLLLCILLIGFQVVLLCSKFLCKLLLVARCCVNLPSFLPKIVFDLRPITKQSLLFGYFSELELNCELSRQTCCCSPKLWIASTNAHTHTHNKHCHLSWKSRGRCPYRWR